MLHLFHGDQIEASRQELHILRQQFKKAEVVELDGKTMTDTDFVQATEATSLFGGDRLVIIENLFTKQIAKKKELLEKYALLIKALPKETDVVFWEEKELGKTILSIFPKSTDFALFKPDRLIFTLMDAIRPNNTLQLVDLMNSAVLKDAPELIFTMLVRQFRYLLMVKELGKQIPELSPWQASKFARQAQFFDLKHLVTQYRKLLEIDVKIKTGETPFSLTEEMRLFLIQI